MSDVIFDHTDIRDVISQEENGMLVRLGDSVGFSEAVKRLLQDFAFRKMLSQGAFRIRDEYQEHFSAEGVKQVWEQVLTEHPSQRGGLQ
jgi:glycosyltransferase involved in cell wall biosynthesis